MSANEEHWYALRTYYSQEQKVGRHLDRYGLTYFIPMRLSKKTVRQGDNVRSIKQRVPFVHNLIFIQRPADDDCLRKALAECPFQTHVYCQPESEEWQDIAGRDILDLRIICDQSFCEPTFVTRSEGEVSIGTMVRVTHGPLQGIRGMLVRRKKRYYILKDVGTLYVQVMVSRWCCEPETTE